MGEKASSRRVLSTSECRRWQHCRRQHRRRRHHRRQRLRPGTKDRDARDVPEEPVAAEAQNNLDKAQASLDLERRRNARRQEPAIREKK